MESVSNTPAEVSATMDCEGNADAFEKVRSKKSHKRKRDAAEVDMQPEETVAAKRPQFPALSGAQLTGGAVEMRKVPVPAHRYSPLKENWMRIFTPIVEHLQLQVRFNLKTRNVEIKTCRETSDIGALTRAADFVKAFVLGFQVEDALALIRLDELFLETFDVTDVKPLKGDHSCFFLSIQEGSYFGIFPEYQNGTNGNLQPHSRKSSIKGVWQHSGGGEPKNQDCARRHVSLKIHNR
uniref:RNA-binding protein PNO1-like n=1 Tax=Sinocyclocheilus anshuiensis TaxID=1608454 RepID=A0A671T8R2_9TELE